MPRNYWKWTVPLLCVTCLGWGYSQEPKQTISLDPVSAGALPVDEKPPSDEGSYSIDQGGGVRKKDKNIPPDVRPFAKPLPDRVRVHTFQRSVPTTVHEPMTDDEIAQRHEYRTAIDTLRSDEMNADAKQQARQKLVELVTQMIEADLETRKQDVAMLEKRVEKLRTQFDKRNAAQDKIIDLRLKMIQNEIDGLGVDQLFGGERAEVSATDSDEIIEGLGRRLAGVGMGGGSRAGVGGMMVRGDDDEGFGLRGGGMGSERGIPLRTGDDGDLPGDGDDEIQRPTRPKVVYRTVTERTVKEMSPEEIKAIEQYQSSLKVLRSGESDTAMQSARDALRQVLTWWFTQDLASREKDLVELETRVKKLREQLDKRVAAKDQIVELQMATIQNEIDGLGFNDLGDDGLRMNHGVLLRDESGALRIINPSQPPSGFQFGRVAAPEQEN